MVVTSNKSFTEWGGVFGGDSVLASAALDRLLHRCTVDDPDCAPDPLRTARRGTGQSELLGRFPLASHHYPRMGADEIGLTSTNGVAAFTGEQGNALSLNRKRPSGVRTWARGLARRSERWDAPES